MKKVHAVRPLIGAGLLFIETPHRGAPKVWGANDLADAIARCTNLAIQMRRGDEADALEGVDTLDELMEVVGADLRSLEVYTWSSFEQMDLESFGRAALLQAEALGWVVDELEGDEA
ncbi:MAG: hypothetical protein QE265_12420 [Rhodoferax sp.]|nr:hypothetical protein [Rhodoferax sp.]